LASINVLIAAALYFRRLQSMTRVVDGRAFGKQLNLIEYLLKKNGMGELSVCVEIVADT
jgi:hypothetical protein